MKLSVYTEDKDDGPKMKLYLEYDFEDCSVDIWGIDADDENYLIGSFSAYGLRLFDGINENTQWPLDKNGRIKLVE